MRLLSNRLYPRFENCKLKVFPLRTVKIVEDLRIYYTFKYLTVVIMG